MIKIAIFAGLFLGLASTPALALDGITSEYVDLSFIIELAAEYLLIAVVAGGLYLFDRTLGRPIREWLGEAAEASARQGVEEIMRMGMRLAMEQHGALHRAKAVRIKNRIVRQAARYTAERAPGYVERFGLKPVDLEKMARARVQDEIEHFASFEDPFEDSISEEIETVEPSGRVDEDGQPITINQTAV